MTRFLKSSQVQKKAVTLSVGDQVGILEKILKVFEQQKINLTHIESRPSSYSESDYDFEICYSGSLNDSILEALSGLCDRVHVLAQDEKDGTPWFPRRIRELGNMSERVLGAGRDLEADHPGFADAEYRKRRQAICDLSNGFEVGSPVPRIDYSQAEVETWSAIYSRLSQLYSTHACESFRRSFPLFEQNCGFSATAIPQLEDVSNFLQDCTGFRIHPVSGLLSSRDFLAGLAFRVFHSSQYIRHHSKPFYTPEPDICHELLGHVPLLADPEFADFSQTLGLASLGASDDFVKKLATCYWFTVEFGLCREGESVKAYGAGLLSSFGELEYSLSKEAVLEDFDPFVASVREYPITTYQPVYFVCESFADANRKLREFARSSDRGFELYYDPYCHNVTMIDHVSQLKRIVTRVQDQLSTVVTSLSAAANG